MSYAATARRKDGIVKITVANIQNLEVKSVLGRLYFGPLEPEGPWQVLDKHGNDYYKNFDDSGKLAEFAQTKVTTKNGEIHEKPDVVIVDAD